MSYQEHRLRHVEIFDTTLRDGEQAPGYSLTIDQKVELSSALEHLGVNTIETGFPISSPVDFEATRQICKNLKRAKVCGFARAQRGDVSACANAMADAIYPQVQIASVSSDIHLLYKRQASRGKIIEEANDAVEFAKSVGFTDISIAVEDATRSDFEFIKRILGQSIERGASTIAIPDTVGCCLPEEFGRLIKRLRRFVGPDIRISAHCHNDLGLAVANSVAALRAGADEIQTTLCGIGERAGNTSLEELVAVLNSKKSVLYRVHDVVHHKIYDTCAMLAHFLELPLPAHKPVIGDNAFSTEAGMHQQGVINRRFTYEHLRAEDYGATPRVALGRHSGRTIIRRRLQESGMRNIEAHAVDALYEELVRSEHMDRYHDAQYVLSRYEDIVQTRAPVHHIRSKVLPA